MANVFKTVSGKIAGRSHGEIIPCQDSVITLSKNGVTAVVLSDGCGSAILSHHGSKVTVESVSEFLVEKFDALYEKDELEIALYLMKVIVGSQIKYVAANREALIEEAVKLSNAAEKDETKRHTVEKLSAKSDSDLVRLLYGTINFIAVKDNKILAGQHGDGRVGIIADNKLSILLEEKKDEAVNQTEYPYNTLTKYIRTNDMQVCSSFRILKMEDINLQGAFAVSDGCDSLIEYVDKDTFFRVRFRPFAVNMLYEAYTAETPEKAQEFLNERLLKLRGATTDDCSVGIMVRELPEKPENLERVILERPRPKMDDEEETTVNRVPMTNIPTGDNLPFDFDEEEAPSDDNFEDPAEEYATDDPEIRKAFDAIINASEEDVFDEWIDDAIEKIQTRCLSDDSLDFKAIIELYRVILESAKDNGEYRYNRKDANIPEIYFEIIKDGDFVLVFEFNDEEIIARPRPNKK